MSLEWIIYLANISGNWEIMFWPLAFIAAVGSIVSFIAAYVDLDLNINADDRSVKTICRAYIISLSVLLVSKLIIPNPNTIYMMAGVSTIKQAIVTPEAQKVIEIPNLELDKQLTKLQKDK